MAVPLPAPEPAPVWCPGGGQAPAGTADYILRFVYGGGCATCRQPVSVGQDWLVRPHHTREFLRGER